MDAALMIAGKQNTHLINNMTVSQILEETRQSLESVTGMAIHSVSYRVKSKPERIETLKNAVCMAYNINVKDLIKRRRTKDVVRPRQMFYYFATEVFGLSLVDSGKIFNHNHTTVIHSREKVRDLLSINDEETINKLELVNEYLK